MDEKVFLANVGILARAESSADLRQAHECTKNDWTPGYSIAFALFVEMMFYCNSNVLLIIMLGCIVSGRLNLPFERNNNSKTDKREKDFQKLINSINLRKEVADGLRLFFAFTLKNHLLYSNEMEQANTLLSEEYLTNFTYIPSNRQNEELQSLSSPSEFIGEMNQIMEENRELLEYDEGLTIQASERAKSIYEKKIQEQTMFLDEIIEIVWRIERAITQSYL